MSALVPGAHVILVLLDQAGWHMAKALSVPANVTLLHLPPYSPGLNPAERVWAYLRSHYLSNRVFKDYDDLFNTTGATSTCMANSRTPPSSHLLLGHAAGTGPTVASSL